MIADVNVVRIENNSEYITYTSSVVDKSNLHELSVNDTAYLIYTVSSIEPINDVNTIHDILEITLGVAGWLATANADVTISYRYGTYNYSGLNGSQTQDETYKFVEGEIDTIKIIVTAGVWDFDRIDITKALPVVISNITNYLSTSNATINNPVFDGMLNVNLDGKRAHL